MRKISTIQIIEKLKHYLPDSVNIAVLDENEEDEALLLRLHYRSYSSINTQIFITGVIDAIDDMNKARVVNSTLSFKRKYFTLLIKTW